jgi:hypothetical protein
MAPPVRYCFIREKTVDSHFFLEHVTRLTLRDQHLFTANEKGPARKVLNIANVLPDGDRVLFNVTHELAEYYGLGDYVVAPNLKEFIGYLTEGGFIHPHKDPDLPERTHVRVNVLVSQMAGCVPLSDGVPIAVAIGDAWLILASRCLHSTTPIERSGYRSAISCGYHIDRKRGDELCRL